MPANDDAEKQNDDRFHESRQIRGRGIDLIIVKIGNFRQHGVQRASRFPNLNHLTHPWGGRPDF